MHLTSKRIQEIAEGYSFCTGDEISMARELLELRGKADAVRGLVAKWPDRLREIAAHFPCANDGRDLQMSHDLKSCADELESALSVRGLDREAAIQAAIPLVEAMPDPNGEHDHRGIAEHFVDTILRALSPQPTSKEK